MSEHSGNGSGGRAEFAPRFSLYRAWPEGYQAMAGLERAVKDSGLDGRCSS